MPKNNRFNSFEIALSGVSCGIAVLFLSLGILSGWLLATGYFVGVLAMTVPLSKDFFKGGFGAYAGTCILTLIMGAAAKFWDLVPFIMFFGLHPLVNAVINKKITKIWAKIVAVILKALWFDCALIVGYYLVFNGLVGGSMLPQGVYDIINKYIFLFIFTVGTLIGVVYDFLVSRCQLAVNALVARIKK
ncbi:MAG: hypothetical protein NC311_09745 [Muribaculaceae bacterium]|nr:hypothetical protein [Muribaculaceae bacterium]